MYRAKILADSINQDEQRLTTFEVTFPRFILAEVNTHRVLSRNSASSRAIPLAKQIAKLSDDPFTPMFTSEQKGMSGGDELSETQIGMARGFWEIAKRNAIESAEYMAKAGVHKSVCNRLLEPFMWHTAIISGTEWDNFFALRTAENAQPEFQALAEMMKCLYNADGSEVNLVVAGWHLPLVTDQELVDRPALHEPVDWDYWKKVSVGRCARVSYLTHDGKRDPDKDVELHDRLLSSGHLSPFEHVATPGDGKANFRGWRQYRSEIPNEDDFSQVIQETANA